MVCVQILGLFVKPEKNPIFMNKGKTIFFFKIRNFLDLG